MRKIKGSLDSNGSTTKSCKIARGTVREYWDRTKQADLSWPLDTALDDAALETLLFPVSPAASSSDRHQMPPMDHLYQELRKKGVTLQLLWYEYKEANPDGYQYSQFCHHYGQWLKKLDVTLRQTHRAGEKLRFSDLKIILCLHQQQRPFPTCRSSGLLSDL
jgi:transposase